LRPRLTGAPSAEGGRRRNGKKYLFLPACVQADAIGDASQSRLLRRTMKTHFENGPFRCTLKRSGNYLTSGEPPNMSIQAHLAELERRHRVLEAEIAEAQAHPSIDDLEIVELKRRKLLVKDEIARLQVDTLVH
jgi:hypothetical protein